MSKDQEQPEKKEKKKPQEAVLYGRVSTDMQGASLGDQSKDLLAESAKKRWKIVKANGEHVHTDTVCGERDDCPGLMLALEHFPRGGILVVTKMDRLAREKLKFAWIEKEVTKRKGRIVSLAGEGTEGDDPTDKLLRDIVQAFARYELEMIRLRTKLALTAKLRRGEKVAALCPFGYRIHPEDEELNKIPRQLRDRPVRLAEIPEEMSLVKLIMEAHDAGKPLRVISDALNGRGFFRREGKEWNFPAVWRVVKYQKKLA